MPDTSDEDFDQSLLEFISHQRWFGSIGQELSLLRRVPLGWLDETAEPRVRVELLEVSVGVSGRQIFQLPLAFYRAAQPELEHAFVGSVDLGTVDAGDTAEWFAHDALADQRALRQLLEGFDPAAPTETTDSPESHDETGSRTLHWHTTAPFRLDLDAHSVGFTGEQSNSSVLLGGDLMLKVFRKLDSGRNPDIELHEALTQARSDAVASLRGWIGSGPVESLGEFDLAMLQDFLRTATDGWDYARGSVRDLLNEGDLYADEVGGDFASESARLGETTAHMHQALHDLLATSVLDAESLTRLARRLHDRLDEAVAEVDDLSPYAVALHTLYDQLAASSEPVLVQRVHGDLHLGQTLRTVDGWRIIDFEGEPAKPLSERTALDSPMRDVAGMLRSFDYAAHSMPSQGANANQVSHRAAEWTARNSEAFMRGYAAGGGLDPAEHLVLLRAYEADKAVYEVIYETRNRPTWRSIPMGAVQRLAAALPAH